MFRSLLVAVLGLSSGLFSQFSEASKVGRTFYLSQGYEIEVRVTDVGREAIAIAMEQKCANKNACLGRSANKQLVEDLVRAVRYNRLYTYRMEYYDPCEREMCTPHTIDPELYDIVAPEALNNLDGDIDVQGIRQREAPTTTRNSFLTKVIDGAAAQIGSSTVTELRDRLLKNSKNGKLPLTSFMYYEEGRRKIPIAACTLDEGGNCKLNRKVTVTNYTNGSIGVSYPHDGSAEAAYREASLVETLSSWSYTCTVVYTGSFGSMTAQRVCYYRP
ncbi:hypothetical protein PRUB_a2806 [Pseudoalteromonas rubra]|uniref:Uncharacterized protein n=1 Tax=Pseudoalteromonas rubra TaxID=43658 RepID=A0A8T0CBQ0_9GAMM|nr:hypothetical protein [Pseudoalteromonas rubra]KAF7788204.1 hypothetical protein PRUB_a2806 [Pseudoalteromonas rubra]